MGDLPAENLPTPATVGGDDDTSLVTEIVDTFFKIYGTHPGFRVNHAKGVVVKGSFVATPEASALSRPPLFDGSTIPVTVRFSNDGGIPTIPDGAPANPKGMGIKFHMPDESEAVMVILAGRFFPVATPESFRDLLVAISESPDDAPKPTRLDQFAARYPSVPEAFASAGTPDTFAHEVYRVHLRRQGRAQAGGAVRHDSGRGRVPDC